MRAIATLVPVLALASATAARADSSVVVTLTPDAQQLADYLHLTIPQLVQNAEDKINALFQTANLPSLLTAFASTTAIADRGLGVDYAVKTNQLMVGAVANGAIATDASLASADHVVGGFVFNFAVMAGANLGRWGAPRWTVFVNGFYAQAGYHDLEGHLTTGGAHVQYHALDGTSAGAVRWLGVDVTSGLELARWTISTQRDALSINFKVANPQGDSEYLTYVAMGKMNVEANSLTVPLEVTTGVRFGGVLAVYAGGGLDLTSATATIDVDLQGQLLLRSDKTYLGDAHITSTGQASPGSVTAHALAGLQVDVPHANVYVQGIVTPADEGVAFGLRATF
ncbi:MAG: hypothetical protein ABI591_24735 [Kofleriaceae bacterium]